MVVDGGRTFGKDVILKVAWNPFIIGHLIPPSDVSHADAIPDVANDGEDDVHDCEFERELNERLLPFSSFFSTFAPLSAALERKVGERGHQHDRGVRNDRLEDVLVPAGGDAKEEAGHEHCRKDGCYNWNLVSIVEVITTKRRGHCDSLPTQ